MDQERGSYEQFRTGLSFPEVREALALEARDVFEREGRRMFITRATVLGRMHQLKQELWRAHRRRAFQLADDHMPEPDVELRKDPSWDIDYPEGSAREPGDIF